MGTPRKSPKLKALEAKWERRRVSFYLLVLPDNRGEPMSKAGPYTGTVFCVTDNSADYDGYDGKGSPWIVPTGQLMIRPDQPSADTHKAAYLKDCTLIPRDAYIVTYFNDLTKKGKGKGGMVKATLFDLETRAPLKTYRRRCFLHRWAADNGYKVIPASQLPKDFKHGK